MPKVKVETTTPYSPEDTFEKISHLLQSDAQLKKIDPTYSCQLDPPQLSASASGTQFKAHMKVSENHPGAKVEVVVDIPWHLAFAKGFIQKTLQKKLQGALP